MGVNGRLRCVGARGHAIRTRYEQLIDDDGVPDDFREFGRVQMSEDLEAAAGSRKQ